MKYADFTADAKFADLAACNSLEELTVAGDDLSAEGLDSLAAVKHLKALHIANRYYAFYKGADAIVRLKLDGGDGLSVLETEIDGFQRALSHLRQSHPGIVIDGDVHAIDWRFEQEPPWEAITYAETPEPPWDALEPSTLRSTWLPARYVWVSPSFFRQAGVKASDAAGSSTATE